VFGLALALVIGGLTYGYVQLVLYRRSAQAVKLTAQALRALRRAPEPLALERSGAALRQALELDPAHPEVVKGWMLHRVLTVLLSRPTAEGLGEAIRRAERSTLRPDALAAARVVSHLADHDLAGALDLVRMWDARAGADPVWQLASAVALERAGDSAGALERYERSANGPKGLAAAHLFFVRLHLLEKGPKASEGVLRKLSDTLGDTTAVRWLEALSASLDIAEEGVAADPIVAQDPSRTRELPDPLRPLPAFVAAVQAMEVNERTRALEALTLAMEGVQGPVLATWVGFVALRAGSVEVAEAAERRAARGGCAYPGADLLRARTALAKGRLDETMAVLRRFGSRVASALETEAAVAYENLDAERLGSLVDELRTSTATERQRATAEKALDVLLGRALMTRRELQRLASSGALWGGLVAVDAALDRGWTELAAELLEAQPLAGSPPHELRRARLLRLRGDAAGAVVSSERSLRGTLTRRVLIERVQDLAFGQDPARARRLVACAGHDAAHLVPWLRSLVDVGDGQVDGARADVERLPLPSPEAPLVERLIVARALDAVGDIRWRLYRRALSDRLEP
jgi:hypothetical protein